MADPLPQAMILTSIVLSLGTTAFGLALAYRSWRLSGHDEVVDDIEDRILASRAAAEADDEAATGLEDAGIDYDMPDTAADLAADGMTTREGEAATRADAGAEAGGVPGARRGDGSEGGER